MPLYQKKPANFYDNLTKCREVTCDRVVPGAPGGTPSLRDNGGLDDWNRLYFITPLRNGDHRQISLCKAFSVREVMRIRDIVTQH